MKPLDKFGHFVVSNFRDKAIEQNCMLLKGQLRGKAVQQLQQEVQALSDTQKDLVKRVVIDLLDTALHDLLFAFQDAHDRQQGIEILVDDINVAETSGMLHGEHLGEGGWIEKYSQFK